ncbi:MAG TPA: polysaccharide biosynthesis/export family protein [Solirubrobacteraceae bacterium]|jgi:polysaccharide export outer membrane protein
MAAARMTPAALLILGLALAAPGLADNVVKAPSVDASYLVQPGDSLAITVWKEQDLQGEFLVRPDGGLTFPLAGNIEAGGHTIEEIRTALTARLVKFVPDPVVTVGVKAVNGSMIFVVGKVNHPGNFPLIRPIDVMQALSLAGGATPFADVDGIRILRREGERQVVFRFRYDDVRRGRALSQNILLQSGDTVVVP